jgi:hypothetical protein
LAGDPIKGGLGLTESTDPTAAYGTENPNVVITGEHSGLANLLPGNPGQVDPPSLDSAEPAATGGTLASGEYVYAVSDQFNTAAPGAAPVAGTGESEGSVSAPVTVTGPTGEVNLTWGAVCHAADYKIYRAPFTPSSRSHPACANIGGATRSSYTPATADAGAAMRVVVTAKNVAGSASATSSQTGPIQSAAMIRALLMKAFVPRGKGARIGTLLKHNGYAFSFLSPSAGRLTISWYAVPGGPARAGFRQSRVALITVTFHQGGKAQVKIVLTAKGRKLLKSASHLKAMASGSFTMPGNWVVSGHKAFKLKR